MNSIKMIIKIVEGTWEIKFIIYLEYKIKYNIDPYQMHPPPPFYMSVIYCINFKHPYSPPPLIKYLLIYQ